MIDKEKLKSNLKELVDTVVFVVIAVILIRFFVAELRWIPSGSMLPTLVGGRGGLGPYSIEKTVGDRIVVEKISKYPNIIKHHRFENYPKRGDIMIFYPPFVKLNTDPISVFSRLTGFFCKDVAYIKRVIGLPGEKFEIKQEPNKSYRVYINDKPLKEDYIMSEFDYVPCRPDMKCGPFIIPEGQYFMMGDNRGNSQDSRFWGTLSKERFIGRAVFVFWPLNRIKVLGVSSAE